MQTPTPATTAINTQLLQALISLDPLLERIRSNDSGSDRWEQTKQITDQARAAVQAALHQDVLEELIYAHRLIHESAAFMDSRTGKRHSVIILAGGSL